MSTEKTINSTPMMSDQNNESTVAPSTQRVETPAAANPRSTAQQQLFASSYLRQKYIKYDPLTDAQHYAIVNALEYLNYKRYAENVGLADLYKSLFVPEDMFNAALNFIQSYPTKDHKRMNLDSKPNDNIPDVFIKISDKLCMVKLPSNDPRMLVLGHLIDRGDLITENYQCIVDALTLPDRGFYVFVETDQEITETTNAQMVLQTGRIVGQSYAFFAQNGGFVLDRMQLHPCHSHTICILGLDEFSKEIMNQNQNIKRISMTERSYVHSELMDDTGISCRERIKEREDDPIKAARELRLPYDAYTIYFRKEEILAPLTTLLNAEGIELSSIQNEYPATYELLISNNNALRICNMILGHNQNPYKARKNKGEPVKLSDFVSCAPDIIKFITSDEIMKTYHMKYMSLLPLIKMEFEKIKLLTTKNAVTLYGLFPGTRDLLQNLEEERIKLLINDKIIEFCKKNNLLERDLMEMDNNKLTQIISSVNDSSASIELPEQSTQQDSEITSNVPQELELAGSMHDGDNV